jgi:hypothetical protein
LSPIESLGSGNPTNDRIPGDLCRITGDGLRNCPGAGIDADFNTNHIII